jgi:hypothetical protein
MRRREFIALAASAALVSPRTNAQQRSGLPLVAFLSPVSAAAAQPNLDAFRQGMSGSVSKTGETLRLSRASAGAIRTSSKGRQRISLRSSPT